MRTVFIISLFYSLLFWGWASSLHAQATTTGTVRNEKTGQPLEGAHVYLSGTQIGTATNAAGRYTLQNIPPGGHRVVVSIIGYKTQIADMVIGPEDERTLNFKLKSVIYELPEIYVGDLDKGWEKDLERFTRNFIGETTWADSVKILNPEVLRFDKNWWGKFTAEALAPLRIENRALGYYITYHLKEFEHTGMRTRWDGEPLFSEMEPADSAQAAYWAKNRQKAFYGSVRHFLLALQADRVNEEGFILYNQRRGFYGNLSGDWDRTTAERILEDGKENYLHRLNFFGRLEIIYTEEGEDRAFVEWQRNNNRGPADMQRSYLELNEHPVTFDADGEFIQPYGATQFGYFAYTMMAEATPREYRPAGWTGE